MIERPQRHVNHVLLHTFLREDLLDALYTRNELLVVAGVRRYVDRPQTDHDIRAHFILESLRCEVLKGPQDELEPGFRALGDAFDHFLLHCHLRALQSQQAITSKTFLTKRPSAPSRRHSYAIINYLQPQF